MGWGSKYYNLNFIIYFLNDADQSSSMYSSSSTSTEYNYCGLVYTGNSLRDIETGYHMVSKNKKFSQV